MTVDRATHDELDALFGEERWLYRLARSLVDDHSAAQDLVQDTWVAALKNPPPDVDRPRRWLRTVAARLARRRSRRRAPGLAGSGELFRARDEQPEQAAIRSEAGAALRTAVAMLDPPDRETILLIHEDHLSPEEVARALQITPRALRMRLASSYREIKVKLGGEKGARDGSWALCIGPLIQPPGRRAELTAVGSGAFVAFVAAAIVVLAAGGVFLTIEARRTAFPERVTELVAPRDGAPVEDTVRVDFPSRSLRAMAGTGGLRGAREDIQPAEQPTALFPPQRALVDEPLASFKVHGRVGGYARVPHGLRAYMLPEGFHCKLRGTETMVVRDDCTFDLEAFSEGAWRVLIKRSTDLSTTGHPTYSTVVQFSSTTSDLDVELIVPETATVVVATKRYEDVWLRRSATPGDPWKYESACAVTGNRATFVQVPLGDVVVLYRPDGPEAVYEILGTLTIRADGDNELDLDELFGDPSGSAALATPAYR